MAAEVQFLMDQSDTILAYEKKGLDKPFGQDPLMTLLESMDRVEQLELIYGKEAKFCNKRKQKWTQLSLYVTVSTFLTSGINKLTSLLNEFLEQCASEGKVRKKLIKLFFLSNFKF